ncbi:MAG TPA: hypothetical protein V6D28_14705 [Leptolyngbyaceae cyanobacterium]
MKYIALLLLLTVWLVMALPAEASFCRQFNDRKICILNIRRSAKHHWEYRVTISIDGVAQPKEVYNCRDRKTVKKNGTVVPFETDAPGDLICNLVNK